MIRAVGTKRLVLDLSCRRREDGSYAVVTDRWQKFTDLVICDETLSRLSSRCDEFLIHAADVEGKRSGIPAVSTVFAISIWSGICPAGRWMSQRGALSICSEEICHWMI